MCSPAVTALELVASVGSLGGVVWVVYSNTAS